MSYRPHDPPALLLFGYDPVRDLPQDHLARLVELVVEEALTPEHAQHAQHRYVAPGQPAYDPRLLAKVLTYGYATGVRSSRQLERMCRESLPYLFLTRGDAPSYKTICSFRVEQKEILEQVWVSLFSVAGESGMKRLGRIVVDSSKFRANASPEAVVKASEYTAMREEFERILKEAETADTRDEQEPPGQTQVGQPIEHIERSQMREILRRVRKQMSEAKHLPAQKQTQAPAEEKEAKETGETGETTHAPLGPRMLPRVKAAVEAIKEAEEEGRKHACLTDPDARMMGEGREKNIRECHSFEVAVDREDGLLVTAGSINVGTDNARLEPLVESAKKQEPQGVVSMDGDSGYYSGDAVARLIEAGIDTCIPDSNTACDLHRGQPIGTTKGKTRGQVQFTYDSESDCYVCPEGNRLQRVQTRKQKGQTAVVYRAERDCCACPLKNLCLTQAKAKRRTLRVGVDHALLEAALQRFSEASHVERYSHRAEVVETIFGFIRGVLGFHRWLLRGSERVSCEASLFKLAYQFRKVHMRWRDNMKSIMKSSYPAAMAA